MNHETSPAGAKLAKRLARMQQVVVILGGVAALGVFVREDKVWYLTSIVVALAMVVAVLFVMIQRVLAESAME